MQARLAATIDLENISQVKMPWLQIQSVSPAVKKEGDERY
uniref:Uncharacterized protein n=1 Tax=Anguilla anguilla TaxID=7936 RepID=A0A0E9R858_ANGAN